VGGMTLQRVNNTATSAGLCRDWRNPSVRFDVVYWVVVHTSCRTGTSEDSNMLVVERTHSLVGCTMDIARDIRNSVGSHIQNMEWGCIGLA